MPSSTICGPMACSAKEKETKDMLLLPQPLAQALADYLAQRPYCEVAVLIAELTRIKPAPSAVEPKDPNAPADAEKHKAVV